jgi:tetratricopeptide (TPR) repeat protein
VSFDAPADTEGHETGGSIEREESEGVEPAGAAGPAGPDPALFGSTEAGVPTAPDDGAEIGDGAGEDDESLAASSFPSELPGERAGEEAEGECGVVELPRESASEEAREVPEEDIGGELPMLSFDEDDDDEAEEDIGDELPMLTFDDEPAYEESGSAAAEEEVAADAGPGGDGGEERIGGDLPLLAFGDVFADEDPEVDQSATVDAGGEDASEAGEEESVEPAEAVDGEAAEPAEPMDGEAAVEEVEEAREEAVAEARQEAVAGTREDEAGLAPPAASPREELEALRERLQESPDEVELHQRAVELAFRAGDDELLARAYADLGHALQRNGDEARARAVFQQALDLDPELEDARAAILEGDAPSAAVKEVTSSEDYVDLGAMILGDEADEEKTTRFRVAYEAPSGDEDADFARMLSQFKAKVAENFDTEDVKGHHDLGTAYKEMGLLDEAIEEFQAALRASADHLPTYELLGQVFLEQGNADAALRVLKRAQDTRWQVEDELIGIYYYTARAHEELGQRSDAVEYYDRVFSMDINFADVTDRLRELR